MMTIGNYILLEEVPTIQLTSLQIHVWLNFFVLGRECFNPFLYVT